VLRRVSVRLGGWPVKMENSRCDDDAKVVYNPKAGQESKSLSATLSRNERHSPQLRRSTARSSDGQPNMNCIPGHFTCGFRLHTSSGSEAANKVNNHPERTLHGARCSCHGGRYSQYAGGQAVRR